MLRVVNADGTVPDCALIDEIVRGGANGTPAAVPEAEVGTWIAELAAT
ncbi:hypothetical protein ACFRAI_39545 [Streptomyces sp. NPDC056637]